MTDLDAVTYDKVVIFPDGTWEQTQQPPEVFVACDYMWSILSPKCAVAYCRRQGGKPENAWWRGAKLDSHRPLNGPIVLFRHWAALKLSDLVVLPCFKHANFSALTEEQTETKWAMQLVPSQLL